jgi:hypothetical protein
MDNKKRAGIFIFCLIVLGIFLVSIQFVSAYGSSDIGSGLRQGSEQVINWVVGFAEPFLRVILGGQDYTGLLLFEKLLIYVLLVSIIYVAFKNIDVFDDHENIVRLISGVIALISVRYMDVIWINTLLLGYGILGIAIAGLLPFIIYLFFINSFDNDIIRKVGWVFFIVVYFGLWSTNTENTYASIFFWTMLVAFVFLLLDGTIHHYLEEIKWKDAGKSAIHRRMAEIDAEISKMERSAFPDNVKNHELKKLRKERREMFRYENKV